MKVYSHEELPQGSLEWFRARMGRPTASEFSKVMAKVGPKGGTSHREYIGRTKYMYRLAGEIITGEPEETYSNADMLRGQENEGTARGEYEYIHGLETQRVGFIINGACGASPDALIGDKGLLEIKDAKPSVQIARLMDGALPPEHKAQVQGQLMVAEREWCDFVSHCHGLPPLIVRVERDEKYIAEMRAAVDRFVDELQMLVRRIGAMW